ncbi:MAG: radical SAM protein [Eubacterium sp.]|nr:radical SAM protein [Eubacterium sp.]
MQYTGRIFRPPSEARSLILQVTIGCSHNRCTFCDMYKEKRFSLVPMDRVLADIEDAKIHYQSYINRVFLADGDAMIRPTKDLLVILKAIQESFPFCQRITAYATPKSLLKKTPQELEALRAAGLTMVYLGLESGNDDVLRHVCKGATAAQIIEAAGKAKGASMMLSVTAISGLGGRENWEAHALDTARVLSTINPEYIGLLTLRLEGQAPLKNEVAAGEFTLLSPDEILQETLVLLHHIDSPGSIFRANHISNYVNLAGTLNQDRDLLIGRIQAALEGKVQIKSEYLRTLDLS